MKTWILILCAFTGANICKAQPILEENFIYPAGVLTQISSWIEDPVGVDDVEVIEGNLFYSGYPSSGAGNQIFLDGGSAGRSGITRSFSQISGDGKKLFLSFLMNVKDTLDLGTAGIIRIKSLENVPRLFVYIQKLSGINKYRIGLTKTGAGIVYDPELRNIGETYLIVASYSFNPGNDSLILWINPDLSGAIPAPNIIHPPSPSDAVNLRTINLTQASTSGNIYIDGIRLDSSWKQAPLPVELSSFTAQVFGEEILIRWRTETEIGNYGFDLEKKKNGTWTTLIFKEGHGNSNIPNEYSYSDKDMFNCSEFSYRLKQIDNDGAFTYSDEINVKITTPEFFLFQNYPNPFNPETRIRLKVPEVSGSGEADIKLILYNILGSEIVLLLEGKTQSGIYEFIVNAENLNIPAGVYFYTVQINYKDSDQSFFAAKKMVLQK